MSSARHLMWRVPKTTVTVIKERKMKKRSKVYRIFDEVPVSVPERSFFIREEAMRWCREHGISFRTIQMEFVQMHGGR